MNVGVLFGHKDEIKHAMWLSQGHQLMIYKLDRLPGKIDTALEVLFYQGNTTTMSSMSSDEPNCVDPPFYFPLTPDYPVGQSAPIAVQENQFGNGSIDGDTFQFTTGHQASLQFKRDLLAKHRTEHVGRHELAEPVETCVCDAIRQRLISQQPQGFSAQALAELSLEELAMLVQEDLAVTCVRRDDAGRVVGDWLAAAHVCMPSGWNPAEMLGRSFAQIHRTVQIDSADKFLLEHGKVKDYVGQMLRCATPHVRFIWTLQVGGQRNRNPATRGPSPDLHVDPKTGVSNVFFRVERQTITSFADVGASLFTIRTYLYPLAEVIADAQRRALLKEAVANMPPRVVAYKGWSEELVAYVASL